MSTLQTTFTPNTEGVFLGLSQEDYKAAPGIGQSMLKAFDAEATPRHFQESLTRPKVVTQAMDFGTVAHAAILTPHLFDESHYVRPETYPSAKGEKPWHGGSDWCKEWMEAHADRPVLVQEEIDRIAQMAEAVRSLPIAGDIIKVGQKEVSFFKMDEETGLLLKCRLDAIATATDGTTHCLDLKKVRRGYAHADRFGLICADLGYDIQCGSYLNITGASKFIFVPMEEAPPFEVEMFELDEVDITEGYNKWRKLLLRYAEAVADGTWPGYTRTVKRIKLPSWAASREKPEPESIYED